MKKIKKPTKPKLANYSKLLKTANAEIEKLKNQLDTLQYNVRHDYISNEKHEGLVHEIRSQSHIEVLQAKVQQAREAGKYEGLCNGVKFMTLGKEGLLNVQNHKHSMEKIMIEKHPQTYHDIMTADYFDSPEFRDNRKICR